MARKLSPSQQFVLHQIAEREGFGPRYFRSLDCLCDAGLVLRDFEREHGDWDYVLTDAGHAALERIELEAADRASEAYHDHPSNPSSCQAYEEHYEQRCPCEDGWRDHMPKGK
jgi:hypothetical protein